MTTRTTIIAQNYDTSDVIFSVEGCCAVPDVNEWICFRDVNENSDGKTKWYVVRERNFGVSVMENITEFCVSLFVSEVNAKE